MKSVGLFKICGARHIHGQRVKLRPVEHHYENPGEPEDIKYGCQICESLSESYPNKMMSSEEQFRSFSFSEGTERCPCCGVYVDWEYKKTN